MLVLRITHMNAFDEAEHADNVSTFVHMFNKRLGRHAQVGDQWVRVSPPKADMLEAVRHDPRLMPFTRVGALAKITDVSNEFVTIQVGRDSLVFSSDLFLQKFVRAVDPKEWRPFQRDFL